MQYGVSAVTTAYTPTNQSGWITSVDPVRSVSPGTPSACSTGIIAAQTAVTPSTGRPRRAIRPRSQAPVVDFLRR